MGISRGMDLRASRRYRGTSGSTTGSNGFGHVRLWDKEFCIQKSESDTGWLFPWATKSPNWAIQHVRDMFNAWDEGREPMETLYDGYVVNAIIDACYKSAKTKQWEPIEMEWRGGKVDRETASTETDAQFVTLKTERMPDGRLKRIVKDRETGEISERIDE